MYAYEGGNKILELETDYMRRGMSDTARTLIAPVDLTIFDSTGQARSKVLADSGTVSSNRDDFFVWGDVYVRTMDKKVIRSQSLWWKKTTHKVGSRDYVEIRTPEGDVLRGKGLDADESFTQWSMNSVTGEFPDFKERMDAKEDF